MPQDLVQAQPLVNAETLAVLQGMVASVWFYYLDLLGTFAFACAGVIKAYRLKYDYFGTFLLAVLPAVGGGTLRDLLVGGDRHPPFVFRDPTYMYIVFAVVLVAIVAPKVYAGHRRLHAPLGRLVDLLDTVGIAAFTVIGAKVAISAGLDWYWAPILAALTCSGGGVMSDAITSHDHKILSGEIYEEIGVLGGLFLVLSFATAHLVPHPGTYVAGCVVLTLLGCFALRYFVITRGWRSPTLDLEIVDDDTTARAETRSS